MSLDVYLHGKRVGALVRRGTDRYSFSYAPEVHAAFAAGTPLLSHDLPVQRAPFEPGKSRAFVEGLLPQGPRRGAMAYELGVGPADGLGLIEELGGDCLGAVSFGPAQDADGREEPIVEDEPEWLSDEELEEVVQLRPACFFDPDVPRRMRFALPGERHKLALIYDADGDRWAWPQPGAPSTHIVKPEVDDKPGLVANEHACTLAYRELGLPVVHTEVREIAGQPCLVSKRFDRWGDGTAAERLHQESFAQALGVAPDQAGRRLRPGAPTLAEATDLLVRIDEEDAVQTLMRATLCDLMIGCADLRPANAGLLHGPDGPMLAPFYDIAATEVYGEVRPRPIVIGEDVPPAPLLIDIRHTVELCDVEFQPGLIEAVRLMGSICSALNSVADAGWRAGWKHPIVEEVLQNAMSRVIGFQHESMYLRPPGA